MGIGFVACSIPTLVSGRVSTCGPSISISSMWTHTFNLLMILYVKFLAIEEEKVQFLAIGVVRF
jgi:hypothetical protein